MIGKLVSDRRMDGAKMPQQCSLPKGSLFNGKYTEAELYPGTTIAFSREIEKTDKNARGLRERRRSLPFSDHANSIFPYIDLVFAASPLVGELVTGEDNEDCPL